MRASLATVDATARAYVTSALMCVFLLYQLYQMLGVGSDGREGLGGDPGQATAAETATATFAKTAAVLATATAAKVAPVPVNLFLKLTGKTYSADQSGVSESEPHTGLLPFLNTSAPFACDVIKNVVSYFHPRGYLAFMQGDTRNDIDTSIRTLLPETGTEMISESDWMRSTDPFTRLCIRAGICVYVRLFRCKLVVEEISDSHMEKFFNVELLNLGIREVTQTLREVQALESGISTQEEGEQSILKKRKDKVRKGLDKLLVLAQKPELNVMDDMDDMYVMTKNQQEALLEAQDKTGMTTEEPARHTFEEDIENVKKVLCSDHLKYVALSPLEHEGITISINTGDSQTIIPISINPNADDCDPNNAHFVAKTLTESSAIDFNHSPPTLAETYPDNTVIYDNSTKELYTTASALGESAAGAGAAGASKGADVHTGNYKIIAIFLAMLGIKKKEEEEEEEEE